jgi:hypothetical protein
MPRPNKQLKAADRRLLELASAYIVSTRPASTLLRCKDGVPARAPRIEDDPVGYARHFEEQRALQNYTVRMVAKLLSGQLKTKERELWARGVGAFLEPFFRKQENKRKFLVRGPIKRGELGKRGRIIAEWRRLKAQGTPERDRAGMIAKKLDVSGRHVRQVVAPIKAAANKQAIERRMLKKSGTSRFQ